MSRVHLIDCVLPHFGLPEVMPDLPDELFAARHAQMADRVREAGLDALVLHADRERPASMSYLTGWDPRFEEALLIHVPGRGPTVVTGPENVGFVASGGLKPRTVLYPPFGVLGTDRSRAPKLADILAACGLAPGMAVGVVGGRYFSAAETSDPDGWIDAPAFVVDVLRQAVGETGRVVNATALFSHPTTGLRAVNDIDQLARFEFGASHSSQAIRNILFGIRPGMREFEVAGLTGSIGLPVSCHPMLASGPRARFGLNSPSHRRVERGDPVCFGYGLWGGFNNRAGWLVEDLDELPRSAQDYVEAIVAPFYKAVTVWYETIDIGVTGGAIDAAVKTALRDSGITLMLNPGHLIHIEEWLNTPIYPESREALQSGQAVQCDLLPTVASGAFTSGLEDGVILLDDAQRAIFAQRYPGAWARIVARRAFMADVLGIQLRPAVLPTSNVPAYLPPFLLRPGRVLAKVA